MSQHQRNFSPSLGSSTSCRAPSFAVPYKNTLFACRGTSWWPNTQNFSLFKDPSHAFWNVSHMSSPSPQHFRTWLFCCRHDNLQGHQEHPPTVPLSQALLLAPCPHQPAYPCRLCASAGRATSSLHGLKPCLKYRVCMFVAPQGILSQIQLYWLKHLPQENLETETLMGPYILRLDNSLFYLFIVFINKNASLTAQMNFLSNYSHLLLYISI